MMNSTTFRIYLSGSLVFLFVLVLPCFAQDTASKPQPKAFGHWIPERAYQHWLDQDVVYIITPEERAAYEHLTSDEERDHFIEQFWLRRDPTPGTPENEFKEEHYRRIAYSNIHFADPRPGWKTDRGRIYIVEGPADEIVQVPQTMDATQQHHQMIWKYKSGKKFLFVDECDCGQYQLEYRLHNLGHDPI